MPKKTKKTTDVATMMAQIQEQLAVLDRKLDSFMTKSLKELAEVLAASKPAVAPAPRPAPAAKPEPVASGSVQRPGRPMYAIVCYACGKDDELPFKPSGDRPVFCRECFAKRKTGHVTKPLMPKPEIVSLAPAVKPQATQASPASKAKKKPAAAAKKAAVKKKAVKKVAKKSKKK